MSFWKKPVVVVGSALVTVGVFAAWDAAEEVMGIKPLIGAFRPATNCLIAMIACAAGCCIVGVGFVSDELAAHARFPVPANTNNNIVVSPATAG